MNQIICTKHSNLTTMHEIKSNKRNRFPFASFLFLFGLFTSFFVYYSYFNYDLYSQEKIAKSLMNSFEITKIYEDNSDYSVKQVNSDKVFFYENSSFSVIGVIDIKKINISYPILSDVSKDFLKISPCRFYGPMPNEVRKSMYCWSQL